MTKTSPGLTFRPAAEMKPIRVSTCLCHFHLICICKPAAPIAPRLHREEKPIGRSAELEQPMGAPVSAEPALPDTLPWEKQHGPLAGSTVSLTHTPPVRHISCSLPDTAAAAAAAAGFNAEQRTSWTSRSILGRYVPSLLFRVLILININNYICEQVKQYFKNHPQEFGADTYVW